MQELRGLESVSESPQRSQGFQEWGKKFVWESKVSGVGARVRVGVKGS